MFDYQVIILARARNSKRSDILSIIRLQINFAVRQTSNIVDDKSSNGIL